MKTRSMLWALVAVLLYAGAASGQQQLKQSDGTITPQGGVGSAANVTLATQLYCEDSTNNLCRTSGGAVRQTTVTSAVTTNTTSTAVALFTGNKTFYGQVVGTGAVTQTQAIYGDIDNDAANGILLCTITLSGTTRTQDACSVITANFSYYYVVTTATTGTSATGAVYAMY